MSSLQMLQSLYDSSDSDIEETDLNNVAKKLPFPKQIETIITNPDEAYNDPTKHQGRFRSFKHERGNWATYVCLPYEQTFSPDLKKCVESTFDKTQGEMHVLVVYIFNSIFLLNNRVFFENSFF